MTVSGACLHLVRIASRVKRCGMGRALLGFAGLICLFSNAAWAVSDELLSLQVGEVRVLAAPDVARVAVGDGQVVNALTTEEKEVIVFARREGSTVLQIWSQDGQRRRYDIEVAPEGARRIKQELRDRKSTRLNSSH